jgi:maltose O-acetyltransferase
VWEIVVTDMVKIYQKLRVWFYQILSKNIICQGKIYQPLLAEGLGKITIGKSLLGYKNSPYFYSGYSYLEARCIGASITIGNECQINNNAVMIAEKSHIKIGNGVLIGTDFCVYDSDFHDIRIDQRLSNRHTCQPVEIQNNVFIGSKVTILKGVTVGENSVVANGSIVTKDIPANQVWAGVPAKKMSDLSTG